MLNLTLSKKQNELLKKILAPNVNEIYVLGSTQSGKTFDICLGCILYAQKLYEYDSKELYYGAIIGWSITTLKGNIVDVIERDLDKLGLKKRTKSGGDYELHWGGDDDKYLLIYNIKFYFFGFNNVLSFNKILGKPLLFVWVDESARIYSSNQLQSVFDELPGRQMSYVSHPYLKTIHSFNVEGNENHPYKLKYIDGKPKAVHFSFFPYDNPKINNEDAMRRVLELFPKGSALQKQKVYNQWVIAEGKVFNQVNVIDNLDDYVPREIVIGIDYGSVHATVFTPVLLAYNKNLKKWHMIRIDTYYHKAEEDTPTTEYFSHQLRLFLVYLKKLYGNIPITEIVLDSAAAHFHNRLVADNIPHSETTKGPNSVVEGVQYMQSLFYKEYLYILKRDTISHMTEQIEPIRANKDESLIELESYRYDTIKSAKSGVECYIKEYDDGVDSLRYALQLMKELGIAPVV